MKVSDIIRIGDKIDIRVFQEGGQGKNGRHSENI